MSRIINVPEGQLSLTEAETWIIDLISRPMEQVIIARQLKLHDNADRVREALQLMGYKYPQSDYTIYPHIINIGTQTSVQYVESVRVAVAKFNKEWRERFRE